MTDTTTLATLARAHGLSVSDVTDTDLTIENLLYIGADAWLVPLTEDGKVDVTVSIGTWSYQDGPDAIEHHLGVFDARDVFSMLVWRGKNEARLAERFEEEITEAQEGAARAEAEHAAAIGRSYGEEARDKWGD